MAAIAATTNPLNKAEVLLFYCGAEQTVNLKRKAAEPPSEHVPDDSDGHGATPVEGVKPIPPPSLTEAVGKGLILNPSCFGTFTWNKLTFVFGIRAFDNVICRVSPEFAPLVSGPKAASGSLGACGDGKTGWLYYLSAKKEPPILAEYVLDYRSSSEFDKISPDKTTSICAYYNSVDKKRYVMFQISNRLQYCDPNKPGAIQLSDGQEGRPSTPMDACMFGAKGYIFFANSNDNLCVADYADNDWNAPVTVKSAPSVGAKTRITVTPSEIENVIYVFYIPNNEESIHCFPYRVSK